MTDFGETERSSPTRLELAGQVAAAPDEVFRAFVDATVLTQWWADEAAADAVIGGVLEARWPAMGWTMRGAYTELDPGRVAAFTWSWDHEPDTPERAVRVTLAPTDGGTRLTISHGDYGPADADERQSHLEGWQHFLPALVKMLGD